MYLVFNSKHDLTRQVLLLFIVIIIILQMRKVRQRGVEMLTQVHMARERKEISESSDPKTQVATTM